MLKAAAGGGGRGMRRVGVPGELDANFERAQREALSSFGDGSIYIEKEVTHARHIEIQVLGDTHGGLVHLWIVQFNVVIKRSSKRARAHICPKRRARLCVTPRSGGLAP
jgi:acetyl/propionyl-CoA carboxylase alpha subunit